MATIIPILAAIIVLGAGIGIAARYLALRRKRSTSPVANEAMLKAGVPFRWRYITLPVLTLLLSLILVSLFYRLLPADVAYHFKNGAPDKWMARDILIAWVTVPQFLLVLLSAAIIWIAVKISAHFQQSAGNWVEMIFAMMGNMVALPQLILCFAMLDIFSYNAYQRHLMPLWVFALIVMVLGGIVIVILFVLAFRRVLAIKHTRQ